MTGSRISGFHRLSVAQRIDELRQSGLLSDGDAELLRQGRHVLSPAGADRIIENVIGVFGLPLALAPNFLVNDRDYVVPMVVEEPSIVAAASFAALLSRESGGIRSECAESLLAGQVHVTRLDNVEKALEAISRGATELIELGNRTQPRLVERGGGIREIETHLLELPDASAAIGVHVLVDTCDAMGANLVNTICETLAPQIAELCGGDAALRILTNLTDRSLVTARVRYELARLAHAEFDAETVRDRIVQASDIASTDPYRAATHNKGVMNGVDAVAIATGNDWRAIEAGAHAYAAASGRYRPLATWSVDEQGDLVGELVMPLKVGVVGGTGDSNAAAQIGLRIMGVESARELAELMAAVGLVQNFAALRALATHGIQAGHMKLHARSVVQAAGVPDGLFEDVVSELVASGEIKTWKAREILTGKSSGREPDNAAHAAGKVILLGEHAVVYGRHAVAVPISGAVRAVVAASDSSTSVVIPEWNVDAVLSSDNPSGISAAIYLIMRELGIEGASFSIHVNSVLPRAMGLGSSAALAVAIIRAFDAELGLGLDDGAVNAIAYKCEELAHGTPSGIDNTLATYDQPMLFRKGNELETELLELQEPPPIVVALGTTSGLTREQVAGVRDRRERSTQHYDAIFDEIDNLSIEGAKVLRAADYSTLGDLMNICHGLLNAIGVSTPELEGMVQLARASGAVGAKLTGGGGGGSIIALCPGNVAPVMAKFDAAGFRTLAIGTSKDD